MPALLQRDRKRWGISAHTTEVFLPEFTAEGNAEFHLKVRENKEVRLALISMHKSLLQWVPLGSGCSHYKPPGGLCCQLEAEGF